MKSNAGFNPKDAGADDIQLTPQKYCLVETTFNNLSLFLLEM